jgi:hypothetical protein
MENTEIKKIHLLPLVPKKTEKPIYEKEKTRRLITQEWKIKEDDLLYENQIKHIQNLYDMYHGSPKREETKGEPDQTENLDIQQCILKQLNNKIYGYRAQDLQKKKFNADLFVDIQTIVSLLFECHLLCYYCKKQVRLLYEFVREPLQWSLERLDNQYGHNRENVVIACLGCNLKRKTMYPERFLFTKQLHILKIPSNVL